MRTTPSALEFRGQLLPLGLEAGVVCPRFPPHIIAGLLSAPSPRATSGTGSDSPWSPGFLLAKVASGAALSWNLRLPHSRTEVEEWGALIWGELSQGPKLEGEQSSPEHSRLYLLEILFCLQHASKIAPEG